MTAAERQRRAKRHKIGDHSLCDPARDCLNTAPPPPPRPTSPPPREPDVPASRDPTAGFGPRGRELWDVMSEVELGPGRRVLLVEACRMADRLDRMDRMLSGDRWFTEVEDRQERVEIVMDSLMSEARQYASTLKALITELEPKPKAPAAAPPTRKGGGAGLSELTRRIENRKRAG